MDIIQAFAALQQSAPRLLQQQVQLCAAQLIGVFARQKDNIQSSRKFSLSKALSHQPLDTISPYGSRNVFLSVVEMTRRREVMTLAEALRQNGGG